MVNVWNNNLTNTGSLNYALALYVCILYSTSFRLYLYVFITIIFIAFSKDKLFKLFISLECKYNKLQFGIRISSIDVSKQMLRISISTTKYAARNPSMGDSFLMSKMISDSICICPAFLSRRASRKCRESLDVLLLKSCIRVCH